MLFATTIITMPGCVTDGAVDKQKAGAIGGVIIGAYWATGFEAGDSPRSNSGNDNLG